MGKFSPPPPDARDESKDDVASDKDDDPITASYPVFLNPSLPQGRRLVVLQHPNRTDDVARPSPSEFRLKSHAGMVELDMPIEHSLSYDRDKGVKWGRALQSSMATKSGGSLGLAGGFGFGAVQQRGGKKGKAAAVEDAGDDGYLDWTEAVRQDKVLRKQTLGGQYPDHNDVQYMIGVFHGKDLHLTPVSSLVHLRPQLHHIDATREAERGAAAGSKDGAPSSTGGGGGGAQPGARAIHMTIKSTGDDATVTTETMADRLRKVQSEPWRRMQYTDENADAAWEVYNESLRLAPNRDTPGQPEAADAEDSATLESSVSRFGTNWGDDELLEAVSGIKKPTHPATRALEAAKKEAEEAALRKVKTKGPGAGAPATKAAPKAGRGRGGGAAAGAKARRGGRGKAAPSSSAATIID